MNRREEITNLIAAKGSAALAALEYCKNTFSIIKNTLREIEQDLKPKVSAADARIPLEFDDKGRLEVHLRFANDVLVFMMHTNVFTFDQSHFLRKSSYARENPLLLFSGMICVYNFLNDSVKYNRMSDSGILIARIFVNMENHFFVEGKKNIGLLYNDFKNDVVTPEKIRSLVDELMTHVLEIDLEPPPFTDMQQISLQELRDNSSQAGFITGKRFGFVLPGSSDDV